MNSLIPVLIALIVSGLCSAAPAPPRFSIDPNLGQDIRQDMKKPVVNINRDTGVSSSQSTSNNVLAKTGSKPSLKNSQGFASDITIRGPLSTVSDNFANVANFGTDAGDEGTAFAVGGKSGPKSVGSQTGVSIALKNDNKGPGFAISNNQAKQFAASTGIGKGTNFWGQANAAGKVN